MSGKVLGMRLMFLIIVLHVNIAGHAGWCARTLHRIFIDLATYIDG